MANVVVTGGAGFIGSNLVDFLLSKKHKVDVFDNLSTGKESFIHPQATLIKGDIRDFTLLLNSTKNTDYIYHLAAAPRIQRSISDPVGTSEINIQGTLNILEVARINKVKKVIFSSSSSVYGDQKQLPLKEHMATAPLSPYALQKLTGEWYCKLYYDLYKLPTISLRFFSVYGPRQNEKDKHATVIAKFQYLKRKGMPLPIYGSGEQTRDFTHVSDVVQACFSVLNPKLQGRGQIYNVCSAKPYSVNKVARRIGGVAVSLPLRKGEIKKMVGDYSLLSKATGWKPVYSLEDYL